MTSFEKTDVIVPKEQHPQIYYRTKICPWVARKMMCKWNECTYAHKISELRSPICYAGEKCRYAYDSSGKPHDRCSCRYIHKELDHYPPPVIPDGLPQWVISEEESPSSEVEKKEETLVVDKPRLSQAIQFGDLVFNTGDPSSLPPVPDRGLECKDIEAKVSRASSIFPNKPIGDYTFAITLHVAGIENFILSRKLVKKLAENSGITYTIS